MAREYIAAFLAADPETDLEQAGVKGMRWGVRKDRSSGSSSAKSTSSAPAKKPAGNIQDNVESSSARYDRIAGQAKAGRASDLTEQDLKFFNARTDALAKVAKMNEVKPSWLAETTKTVLQTTAQQQMQAVASGIANKYIGGPILDSLKGAKAAVDTPEVSKAIKETVAPVKDSIPDAVKSPIIDTPAYPGTGPAIPQASTTSSTPKATPRQDAIIQAFKDKVSAPEPQGPRYTDTPTASTGPKHKSTIGDRAKEGWNYQPSSATTMKEAADFFKVNPKPLPGRHRA